MVVLLVKPIGKSNDALTISLPSFNTGTAWPQQWELWHLVDWPTYLYWYSSWSRKACIHTWFESRTINRSACMASTAIITFQHPLSNGWLIWPRDAGRFPCLCSQWRAPSGVLFIPKPTPRTGYAGVTLDRAADATTRFSKFRPPSKAQLDCLHQLDGRISFRGAGIQQLPDKVYNPIEYCSIWKGKETMLRPTS